MRLHFLVLASVVFLAACSPRSADPDFAPRARTRADLVAKLGEPTESRISSILPGAELLEFEGADGSKARYQLDGARVVASFREPTSEESTLQYWRHRWDGLTPEFKPIEGGEDAHGNRSFELRSHAAGMAVIYDESSDRITEVIEHGAR